MRQQLRFCSAGLATTMTSFAAMCKLIQTQRFVHNRRCMSNTGINGYEAARTVLLVSAHQYAQRSQQSGLASTSSSSTSSSAASPAMDGSTTSISMPNVTAMAADTNQLRQQYKEAVQRRVVGNAHLRKLIKTMPTPQYAHAVEAVEGAKLGGLVIDSDTCEVYLALLLNAGQLRQAMEVYHYMLSHRVCPNTSTYNQLMDLCLQKRSWDGALTLFSEMQRRGRQPDVVSYESALNALSLQNPPNWIKAVQVFDKLQRNRAAMSSDTYDALMRVYLAMDPFDWRVVYNAYLEMRGQKPKISFGWPSYELVAEAMRRGDAGRVRRLTTFIDAWVQITPPFSFAMLRGLGSFVLVLFAFRLCLVYFIKNSKDFFSDKHSEQSDELVV